ncbi:hypothetical protein ACFL3F_05125 [Planctomycetota bacterium]
MKRRCYGGYLILLVMLGIGSASAVDVSRVVIRDYSAKIDDIAEKVTLYGQVLAHSGFNLQLRETVEQVPIIAIQYGGYHFRTGEAQDPDHVEARAKGIAERLVHAWTLMDHGAVLEVGEDDWNAHRIKPKGSQPKQKCILIRSPIQGYEPLRVMTLYPQDVAAYPWISDAQMLGEYLIDVLQAHYLLFWKHSSDINRFESLRLDRTREGKIFKEIALRALEVARLKESQTYDSAMLEDALARLALSQRERLHRLATTPPMEYESLADLANAN